MTNLIEKKRDGDIGGPKVLYSIKKSSRKDMFGKVTFKQELE